MLETLEQLRHLDPHVVAAAEALAAALASVPQELGLLPRYFLAGCVAGISASDTARRVLVQLR